MNTFFKSFRHAIQGVVYAFKNERSFRIQIVLAIIVLIVMPFVPLEAWEYILIILMIGAVLILEIINTVFERITDVLKPRIHPYAQIMKDLMAAAVLISALVAVVVGLMIFLPHILVWLG